MAQPAAAACRLPLLTCGTGPSAQGNIKRDPASYSDEFGLQWRHYKACLDLFLLKPSQESAEFAELVTFIAQVGWVLRCWALEPTGCMFRLYAKAACKVQRAV